MHAFNQEKSFFSSVVLKSMETNIFKRQRETIHAEPMQNFYYNYVLIQTVDLY